MSEFFENHSNKDIDPDRSHLNYELTERPRAVLRAQIGLRENQISQRAIRKDAVLCDEWIITSDKAFWKPQSGRNKRIFWKLPKTILLKTGEQNIAYLSVHLDESTPHMHMGVANAWRQTVL